jgi:hypothetical protein
VQEAAAMLLVTINDMDRAHRRIAEFDGNYDDALRLDKGIKQNDVQWERERRRSYAAEYSAIAVNREYLDEIIEYQTDLLEQIRDASVEANAAAKKRLGSSSGSDDDDS